MHQALVKIIVETILGNYANEAIFCQEYLEIPYKQWQQWKKGKGTLQAEEMQKIQSLFSDYEWMLVQKLIRQTILFPEKRNYVVLEYKRIKSLIAKKWIQTGAATVELITQQKGQTKTQAADLNKGRINLKVTLSYGSWGYDDVLDFSLPAIVQQQIEDSPVDLLEWVDQNLTDSYLTDSEQKGEAQDG